MQKDNPYGLKGFQVWPTMLFTRRWENHHLHAPAIVDYFHSLRLAQSESIESGIAKSMKSAAGLYESHFDLFNDPQHDIQQLVGFIRSSLALAICVANGEQAKPSDIQVEFVDSWYHITNEGGFHDAHVHHGCSWCGIYYLQLGEAGKQVVGQAPNGGSRFYCPFGQGGSYRDYGNQYLAGSMDARIEDGLLLIFPSYLLHSGLPYHGATDRVVVAFNATAKLLV